MILQRVHPPLLETPMDVFDKSVFTHNDQFFVRWHWADIPTSIDVETFRLNVFRPRQPTAVDQPRPLLRLPRCRDGGGQPMLGKQPWAVPAACRRRTIGQRRDGQRQMARRAPCATCSISPGSRRRGTGALRRSRSAGGRWLP